MKLHWSLQVSRLQKLSSPYTDSAHKFFLRIFLDSHELLFSEGQRRRLKACLQAGTAAHACSCRTGEAEERESPRVQVQPGLHREFKASWGSTMSPYLQTTQETTLLNHTWVKEMKTRKYHNFKKISKLFKVLRGDKFVSFNINIMKSKWK